MDKKCYRLVNNMLDKVIAYAKGLMIMALGIGLSFALRMSSHDSLVKDVWPVWLAVCILIVFVCGPLVLIDELTRRICITSEGIGIESLVKGRGDPWIAWEQVIRVDIQPGSMHTPNIRKVVVRGRSEVRGLGGAYWQSKRVVIPGRHPDIHHLIQVLRKSLPAELFER